MNKVDLLDSKNFKVDVNIAVDLLKIKNCDKLYRVTKPFPNVYDVNGKITIINGSILRVADNGRFSVICTTDGSKSIYEFEPKYLSPSIIDRILNKEYDSVEDYFGVVDLKF